MPDLSQLAHGTSGQMRTFPCSEPVRALEFCPVGDDRVLIAAGGDSRVSIGQLYENPDRESGPVLSALDFEPVVSIRHKSRVHALAWSRESAAAAAATMTPGSVNLNFCSAGSDGNVYCFHGNSSKPSVQTLEGHTSYVNSCVYDPTDGRRVATVSDDRTCRLWDVVTGQCIAQLPLTSAGVSVCWHPVEPLKLLVGERRGLLRIYDLMSEKPLMSLDAGQTPLLDTDWCTTNSLLAGAVAGGSAFVWDLSRGSEPLESRVVHAEGATRFRWCRISEQMYATMGSPLHQVKVHISNSQKVPISHSLSVAGGLSWHPNLPVCAVGGDCAIHVWECGV